MTESRIGSQVTFEGNVVRISSPGFKGRISDVNASYKEALTAITKLNLQERGVVREGLESRLADGVPPIGFEALVVRKTLEALKDLGE